MKEAWCESDRNEKERKTTTKQECRLWTLIIPMKYNDGKRYKNEETNKEHNKQVTNKSNRWKLIMLKLYFAMKVDAHEHSHRWQSTIFIQTSKTLFIRSLAEKKFYFSVFLLFSYGESFCRMRTRMRALNKITIAVSRNIILMELARVRLIRWLRIMNIKCNKFIILRERVKMPFLWLRVCHCRSVLLLFLSQ